MWPEVLVVPIIVLHSHSMKTRVTEATMWRLCNGKIIQNYRLVNAGVNSTQHIANTVSDSTLYFIMKNIYMYLEKVCNEKTNDVEENPKKERLILGTMSLK